MTRDERLRNRGAAEKLLGSKSDHVVRILPVRVPWEGR